MQTESEITSQPETPKGCDCIQRTNDALRETYPGVKVIDGISIGRTVVATYRVDCKRKGGMPVLFASFCPFCGRKYEN